MFMTSKNEKNEKRKTIYQSIYKLIIYNNITLILLLIAKDNNKSFSLKSFPVTFFFENFLDHRLVKKVFTLKNFLIFFKKFSNIKQEYFFGKL